MTKKEILKYIYEVRENAFKEHLPVMREGTAGLLAELILCQKATQVLEIGTCVGVSGMTALSAGIDRLTTVEADEERFEKARLNFEKCGFLAKTVQILSDYREAIGYLDGNTYDIVVLDGPKSGIDEQFEMCFPLLKKGGKFFIDDIAYHGMIKIEGAPHKQRTIIKAVRSFIEKILNDNRVKAVFYDLEDGIAVLEKLI